MLFRSNLLLVLLLPFTVYSQQTQLIVQGSGSALYLNHAVGAKENYYSIGRMYNASPSLHIAPFNSLKMEEGLKIGQVVKVPLAEYNFSTDGSAASDEALLPLYISVTSKESLSAISSKYGKASVSALKSWNKLDADNAPSGKKLIVGYLKVKKELSPLAASAVKVLPVETAIKKQPDPVIAKTPPQPAVVKEPVAPPTVQKTEPPPVSKPVTDIPVAKNNVSYFKSAFEKQKNSRNASKSGTAGVFKSSSGWEDGKYYCLFNDVNPGTVVKITNNSNQKVIYAKVLDAIPDMRQNEGLMLRLSNAAANELGVSDKTFDCTVNY